MRSWVEGPYAGEPHVRFCEGEGQQWLLSTRRVSGRACCQDPARTFWRRFREDPQGHRLSTPSGKIEITSQTLACFGYADAPAHPAYLPNDLPAQDGETLRLMSSKSPHRLHSQLDRGGADKKAGEAEPCRLHPQDAEHLGIADGQMVLLQNGWGRLRARAQVTDAVRPGCVDIEHGAWLAPEVDGTDAGGASNTLVPETPSSRLANANIASGVPVRVRRL